MISIRLFAIHAQTSPPIAPPLAHMQQNMTGAMWVDLRGPLCTRYRAAAPDSSAHGATPAAGRATLPPVSHLLQPLLAK